MNFATRLTSDFGVKDTVCYVISTSNFPTSGYLTIGAEIVFYDNLGPKSFNITKRGIDKSIIKTHKSGDVVAVKDYLTASDIVYRKVLDRIGEDIFVNTYGDMEITDDGDIKFSSGLETLDTRLRIRAASVVGFGINDDVGVDMMSGIVQEPEQLVGNVVRVLEEEPDVERLETLGWSLDDKGLLTIVMNVYPKGMSTGFQVYFKVTQKERGW